ncbi:MAG TPA: MarR family transcriptional regulator [Solirubrobacteraceae bacterium]|nr:MarR family transcriptional regulator [Solirubrobacteraceae bacterium]
MTPRPARRFQGSGENPLTDSVARVIASWCATRPDLDVDPIGITARLSRLHALIAPQQAAVLERFGLRGPDFAVLATLTRLSGEDVSQRRLGVELGLSAGTISLRVDRLVARGLAERQPDPADGRGALIKITARGRELFEACVPEHLARAQALVAGLAEDEREELGRLLGKLLYTLEDPPGDDLATAELGLVVEGASEALQRRRAVGLPPLPGLLVRHVDPAGPAARSGVRTGDLLTSADRRPLRTRHDLEVALASSRGRRRVTLEITRGIEPVRLALPVIDH